jgi:hypothetical protein
MSALAPPRAGVSTGPTMTDPLLPKMPLVVCRR